MLDNCEHLVAACAEFAEAVGRDCPQVGVLATSREPLGIDGERIFRVPSLSLPPSDEANIEHLATFDAIGLFVDLARAQQQTFGLERSSGAVVASICCRLDGIPLGLELAAAQLRSFSLPEVGRLLDDRFEFLTSRRRSAVPRHRTLYATVEWSYNLLEARERAVLRRLRSSAAVGTSSRSEPSVPTAKLTRPKWSTLSARSWPRASCRLSRWTAAFATASLRRSANTSPTS